MNDHTTAPPEPQAGGHYRREADGSLTLLAQTAYGRRRPPRDEAPAQPAGDAATPNTDSPMGEQQ